jgi:hypothetical protein
VRCPARKVSQAPRGLNGYVFVRRKGLYTMNQCSIGKVAGLLWFVGMVICLGSAAPVMAEQKGDGWMQLQMNTKQWQFVEGA